MTDIPVIALFYMVSVYSCIYWRTLKSKVKWIYISIYYFVTLSIFFLQVRKLQKLGDRAFKKKNYADASACYKEALEIDEENVQLLSKRTVSNIELKDYQEARIDAAVLVRLNPHVPQVFGFSSWFAKCNIDANAVQ